MKLHSLLPSKWVGNIYQMGYSLHLIRKLEWRKLQNWVDFRPGDKVCDIACGKGILDLMISKKLAVCYGIDLDRRNIDLAKVLNQDNPNQFINANAEYLPFKSNIFDTIVCNCALEHFASDLMAIYEMNRVLKTKGLLFLSVDSFSYHGITDDVRDMHREKDKVVNFYNFEELGTQLENARFRVIQKKYYIRSKVSSFFFRVGMKLNFGLLFLLTFPLAYPATLLCDHFSGENGGYCLAIVARKTS